jgi:hypothetical protein
LAPFRVIRQQSRDTMEAEQNRLLSHEMSESAWLGSLVEPHSRIPHYLGAMAEKRYERPIVSQDRTQVDIRHSLRVGRSPEWQT